MWILSAVELRKTLPPPGWHLITKAIIDQALEIIRKQFYKKLMTNTQLFFCICIANPFPFHFFFPSISEKRSQILEKTNGQKCLDFSPTDHCVSNVSRCLIALSRRIWIYWWLCVSKMTRRFPRVTSTPDVFLSSSHSGIPRVLIWKSVSNLYRHFSSYPKVLWQIFIIFKDVILA